MAFRSRRCSAAKPFELDVDRIVVTTGFRPDLSFLRELRIELDPAVEAPPRLAPLIDPNFHSCGTVPPHGIEELAHPEPGFVIVGSKSYGRAPTFLMATGYEQVRSVVAELAGDHAAARNVQLVLPGNRRLQCAPQLIDAGRHRLLRRSGTGVQSMRAAWPTRRPRTRARRDAAAAAGPAAEAKEHGSRRNERAQGSRRRRSGRSALTQIIGYGTLYYSYSILAPAMAAELAWSLQWVFGVLSVVAAGERACLRRSPAAGPTGSAPGG